MALSQAKIYLLKHPYQDSMYKVIHYDLPLQILGYGRAVPSLRVSNIDLLRRTPIFKGKSDSFLEKIEERMVQGFGFKFRHMIRWPDEPLQSGMQTSEDLGLLAAKAALQGVSASPEILIHGTTTSSRYTGSQATAIAGQLGLNVPAYETKAGCSTGLAGLHMAFAFLQAGYNSAQCVFSETLSKVIDTQNPESWFGLADGGASFVLQKATAASAHVRILKSIYFTDGAHINLYSTQGILPPLAEEVQKGGYSLRGDPEALRLQALRRYGDLIQSLLSQEERQKIRWVLCHQVNRQIIFDVMSAQQLSGEPVWINHLYGNIGGTTIPFSLTEALEQKLFKKDDLILLMSVGGGISAAAQLWQWQ